MQYIVKNYVRFNTKTTTIHNGIHLYLLQATNLPLSLTEVKNRGGFRRAFSLQSFFFFSTKSSHINPIQSLLFCSQDIDECLNKDACSRNAVCTNTAGGFSCLCKNGFEGNGFKCSGRQCLCDTFYSL